MIKRQATGDTEEQKKTALISTFPAGQQDGNRVVEPLGAQAMDCVLAFLRGQPEDLARNSADFIEAMSCLWVACDLSAQEVWQELEARMALSEKLLKRGIRARKGGRYRSTKLP